MRPGLMLLVQLLALPLLSPCVFAADDPVHVELNAIENTEGRCRLTFVIENKGKTAVESLKLDLALFNTEGAVYRRMLVDMAPVRPAKTIVKTFSTECDCAQLGSMLVNEITACQPGDPATCQDQLSLTSRVKNVRFFK
jgi:hypothetical protein